MRVKLTAQTLSNEAVKAISAGQVDQNYLQNLRSSVLEYINPLKKRFTFICILFVAMNVLGAYSAFANAARNGRTVDMSILLTVLVPVVLFLVAFIVFLYWFTIGRIKGQYNKAIKQGYPNSYDDFKI